MMINQNYKCRYLPIAVSLVLLSLLCAACTSKQQSYFPLNKGYKWRYDVALITRDGLDKQQYIINNIGMGKLNGELVYLRESLGGEILYYSNTTEGIYYLGNKDSFTFNAEFEENRQLVIPEPIIVDDIWEQTTLTKLLKKTGPPQKTEFKIIAKVPTQAKIESINETITVPAGQFENCLKLTTSGSTFKDAGNYVGLTLVSVEQTSWYAPGVGLIKLERLETTQSDALDKGTLLIELAEFEQN